MSEPRTAEVKVVPGERGVPGKRHSKEKQMSGETKIVPCEPTEAMMSAGMAKIIHGGAHLGLKNAFKAMLAASPPAETGEGSNILDCATWVPLDDNGHAEVRVNGRRITSMPSYAGAEEVAERINQALVITAEMRAALSAQPVSPSEGEAVAWDFAVNLDFQTNEPTLREMVEHYYRSHSMPDPALWAAKYIRAFNTHPASDQSDTERMREGDLLWYDLGLGSRVRCTYRGDCEGWPLVTFDADLGSDDPQPVRPSRVSPRAALAEKAADR